MSRGGFVEVVSVDVSIKSSVKVWLVLCGRLVDIT